MGLPFQVLVVALYGLLALIEDSVDTSFKGTDCSTVTRRLILGAEVTPVLRES